MKQPHASPESHGQEEQVIQATAPQSTNIFDGEVSINKVIGSKQADAIRKKNRDSRRAYNVRQKEKDRTIEALERAVCQAESQELESQLCQARQEIETLQMEGGSFLLIKELKSQLHQARQEAEHYREWAHYYYERKIVSSHKVAHLPENTWARF